MGSHSACQKQRQQQGWARSSVAAALAFLAAAALLLPAARARVPFDLSNFQVCCFALMLMHRC